MNVVKEIQRINQRELGTTEGWDDSRSWHAQYKDTSWIFVANLDYDLTEGDVVCIFSQYGEPLNIEMARDQKTGKSMGFAFLQYENQKSSILAVDNMNGSSILSRTLRVDHSYGPKKKKRAEDEDEEETYSAPVYNVAPPILDATDDEPETKADKKSVVDEEDPMAAYFQKKKKKDEKKKKKSSSKDHKQHHHHHKRSSSDRKRHHYDDDHHDKEQSRRNASFSDNDKRRKYN